MGVALQSLVWAFNSTLPRARILDLLATETVLVSTQVAVATGMGMPTTPAFIWLSAKLLRILGTPLPSKPAQSLMVWPLIVAPSRLIELVVVLMALALDSPKPKAPESTE